MNQVTLTMLYGDKPAPLMELLLNCQYLVSSIIGKSFKPYSIAQIHATLIGLESVADSDSQNLNLNLSQYHGIHASMNFEGMIEFLQSDPLTGLPLHIQLAGFQDIDYGFLSRGKRPFQRSFVIDADKVVIMGWPFQKLTDGSKGNVKEYFQILDRLRRKFQSFNILHKYHEHTNAIDNDFYMRIGLVDRKSLTSDLILKTESTLREYLSTISPVEIEIDCCDLFVVSYKDERLPTSTSKSASICNKHLCFDILKHLYG